MQSTVSIKKCSHCQTRGHAKRFCPLLAIPEVEGSGPIPIAHDPAHLSSPFRLELPRKEKINVWDKVAVYRTEEAPTTERVTVNFADTVHAYNTLPIIQKAAQLVKQAHVPKVSLPRLEKQTQVIKEIGTKIPRISARPSFHALSSTFLSRLGAMCTPRDMRRYAAVTLATILFVSIPLPAVGYYQRFSQRSASIVAESTEGFRSLQSSTAAVLGANLTLAATDLSDALSSFGEAKRLMDEHFRWLMTGTQFVPVLGSQIASREHLLNAGQHLALGNTYLIKGVQEFKQSSALSFTERLAGLEHHLVAAVTKYTLAKQELDLVDASALPAEHRQSFTEFTTLFSTVIDDLGDGVDLSAAIRLILGGDGFKRYLVVFQNPHELRATGGFIGSYAVIDVQKGKVQSMTVPAGGSYDLQGQLSEHLVPPAPIQISNKRWEFQDANWFPDFPSSAEKLLWFYEKSRPETLDGVIAVNATVLERFLRVIGTISSETHGLTLEKDTAVKELQAHVESKDARASGTPKSAMSGLLSDLLQKTDLLKEADVVRLLFELHEAAEQKELQVYMKDDTAQSALQGFGWTGEMRRTPKGHDFLAVVNTNIQGQKTDALMKEEIEHQALVQEDGSIINTVLLRRTHTGVADQSSAYGVQNVDFVRLYVPEGAELLEAEGFRLPPEDIFKQSESWYTHDQDLVAIEGESTYHDASGTRITHEFGKTVFGNWIMTPPGSTVEAYLVYRINPLEPPETVPTKSMLESLKEKMFSRGKRSYRAYSLYIQKQSGTSATMRSRVVFPEGYSPLWRSDERMDVGKNGGAIRFPLTSDESYTLLMER